jgi:chemotaxis signal transduction protein
MTRRVPQLLLGVRIAGHALAVEAGQVRGVAALPALRSAPGSPHWLKGWCDLSGTWCAVVDLARLLELEGPRPAPHRRSILQLKPKEGETPSAIEVDVLETLLSPQAGSIEAVPVEASFEGLVTGRLRLIDGSWPILHVGALLLRQERERLRFFEDCLKRRREALES